MSKKRYLITGISGFLGAKLYSQQPDNSLVYGTYFSNNSKPLPNTYQVNLQNIKNIIDIINKTRPDIIIHTAACSDPAFCQNNPHLSNDINVESSILLAKISAEKNISFSFTSTDLVFDGTSKNYKENDATNPLSLYGEQKVKAEQGILKENPNSTIFRLPLLFGIAPNLNRNPILNMVKSLKAKKEIKLFEDEFRTPANTTSLAKSLYHLSPHTKGIYHLGGIERISRYQFGLKVSEIFNLNSKLIIPTLQTDLNLSPPRPADVSLNSEKAFKKGHLCYSIDNEINKIKKEIIELGLL